MNKKGFTLLELITSVALTGVVCILLFQVIFSLKDIHANDSVKTEILIKKSNIAKKINEAFDSKISTIRDCDPKDVNCLTITTMDGKSYNLKLDRVNNSVSFDDFITKFSDTTIIYDDLDACYYYSLADNNTIYNTFVKIRIPIEDSLLEEKFDINVIYQYSDNDSLIGTIDGANIITYIPHC